MVFTPFESLIGGLLIGATVGAYAYLHGRISGISGIAGSVIRGVADGSGYTNSEWKHKLLYIIGLIVSGLFTFSFNLAPGNFMDVKTSLSLLLSPKISLLFTFAGLLVGFGTQLGSGCTSGMMICGLARLSKRAFVSTMVFCGVAMCFVLLAGTAGSVSQNIVNVGKIDLSNAPFVQYPTFSHALVLLALLSVVISVYALIILNVRTMNENTKQMLDAYLPLFNGFVFGVGLALSGMVNPMKVLGFFDFGGANYDPSLVCVALGAIVPNIFVFNVHVIPAASHGYSTPLSGKYCIPSATHIDWKLVTGAAMFGTGWGILGVCPGPFLTNMLVNPLFALYGAGFIGGVLLKQKIIGC